MKKLAIGILNYNHKYEFDRCNRLLDKMNISRDSVFNWDEIGRLKTRAEEYIAFWDVFDKWDVQKAEICMSHVAEKDADVIIHSYIQHVGFKSMPYKVPDPKRADIAQTLCQGLPGISAMVFYREWLWNLLAEHKDIEAGSEKFYRLLFRMFTDGQCKIELIAQPLSEHWSYYGSKTPSLKQAKDDIVKYWKAMDGETRKKLLPAWYEYFVRNYNEFPVTEFFEGVSMNRDELAELLRVREESLGQQIRTANSNAEKKNDFYLFMRNWVELHQSGMNIADRLLEEDVSTVAIYGAGKHGKMLYDELKATKVRTVCWIDKNCAGETIEGCPVIGADCELPQVDAVIVTPYREFSSIKTSLREKTKARIIPLDRLVRR